MTREEEAIKWLEAHKSTYRNSPTVQEYLDIAISALKDRPKGEWTDWLGNGNEWECSRCKCSIESHGSIAYNFCPMCGADMRGE